MCLVRYVSLCERSLQSELPLEQTHGRCTRQNLKNAPGRSASFGKHRGGFCSLVFSCPP